MNKKSSVSQTMMWIVAGFIILLILIIYILFTSGLVLMKNAPFAGGKDEVTLSSGESINLEGQRTLFLILNSKVNEVETKFSDLILSSDFDNEDDKANLKTEGEKIIKNIDGVKCYSISLKKGSKEIGIGEFDKALESTDRITSETLYSVDSKTEINLYEHDC